jgi:hypothetical protein
MTGYDLKAMMVGRGLRAVDVVRHLRDYSYDRLNKILNGRPVPAGFADEFEMALDKAGEERAASIRREADLRIARLLGEDADATAKVA